MEFAAQAQIWDGERRSQHNPRSEPERFKNANPQHWTALAYGPWNTRRNWTYGVLAHRHSTQNSAKLRLLAASTRHGS